MEQPIHPLLPGVPGVSAVEQIGLPAGGVRRPCGGPPVRDDPIEPYFFLTHGAGGDLNTAGLKALAQAICELGHLVVRADLPYRAAGGFACRWPRRVSPGFTESFLEAKERLGPEARWVIGGRSYGGRVASMAVAGGLEAAGLLLYSYPLHRPGDPSQPRVEHWPAIKVPVLFLEGTNDPFCDLAAFERRLPAARGPGDGPLRRGRRPQPQGGEDERSRRQGPLGAAVVLGLAPVIEEWVKGLGLTPRRSRAGRWPPA